MQVQFWGTRGSIPKPGLGTVRYGGNTSCVEVRSAAGTLVVLDCGTGAFDLGQALLRNAQGPVNGHLLVSHTHWDHIQGFPFFAPLFIAGNEWHVYGPRGLGASLREALSGQMQYAYFPVTLDDLGGRLHYHDLVEGTLTVGDIRVTTQYLNHPALTLGYRLEADGVSVVYSTDHEPYSPDHAHHRQHAHEAPVGMEARHVEFIAGADLLIHDAQYSVEEYGAKEGWGHSTAEYAIDTAVAAKVRRLALYHHDPKRSDDAIDATVARARDRVAAVGGSLQIFAAAEGELVEFDRRAAPVEPPAAEETALRVPASAQQGAAVVVSIANPAIDSLVADALADTGVTRVSAACGDVVTTVRGAHPALILLEQEAPGGDAERVCRTLRRDSACAADDLPIVLVKTRAAATDSEAEAAAGITDTLVFPCSRQYIRTRCTAWILRESCRWRNAPQPPDEEARLAALTATGLLDSSVEERFDRYTRIAAALFEVPIALISLVDRERQWFKSRQGIEQSETPRDQAFCAHAILGPDVMQVPDAHTDDRFADNPLVTHGPRVRFYAGVPLSLGRGSARVGTLCVLDHRPRHLDEDQLRLLRDLATLVERELEQPATLAVQAG